MIFPRSFLASFIVLSSTVSASDPEIDKTSLQHREMDYNQGEDALDHNFQRDYPWGEEGGLTGTDETDVVDPINSNTSSFSFEEEVDYNPTGLRGGSTTTMVSIQGSEEFGEDGDSMLLQVSSNMQRMLDLVNNERRSRGIGSLCFNYKLNQAAQDHSNDMKNMGFFSHKGSDGSSVGTRTERRGYDWREIAENIAWNGSIDDAHRGLMNSPGHRRTILTSRYKNIGIGITTYTSGRYRGYYAITQVFGYSPSEGCSGGGGNGSCSDSPRNWYDSDGPEYDCEWYAEGDNCQRYGSWYSNFGKTAKQACCSCGGGSS